VMRAEIHGELELHDQALADAECARQLARTAGDELNLDIALSHLGWALVQLDRGREAEGVAREILGRTPEDTGGYAMLAGALADMDRWGEALEALESALRLDPEAEWLQERRELCVTALRHLMPALDDLEQSIGPDSSWEDWHALGCTRFMFGRLEEAATAFDEAHLRHPDGDRRAEAAMLSPQEADCRLRLIARR